MQGKWQNNTFHFMFSFNIDSNKLGKKWTAFNISLTTFVASSVALWISEIAKIKARCLFCGVEKSQIIWLFGNFFFYGFFGKNLRSTFTSLIQTLGNCISFMSTQRQETGKLKISLMHVKNQNFRSTNLSKGVGVSGKNRGWEKTQPILWIQRRHVMRLPVFLNLC